MLWSGSTRVSVTLMVVLDMLLEVILLLPTELLVHGDGNVAGSLRFSLVSWLTHLDEEKISLGTYPFR